MAGWFERYPRPLLAGLLKLFIVYLDEMFKCLLELAGASLVKEPIVYTRRGDDLRCEHSKETNCMNK